MEDCSVDVRINGPETAEAFLTDSQGIIIKSVFLNRIPNEDLGKLSERAVLALLPFPEDDGEL